MSRPNVITTRLNHIVVEVKTLRKKVRSMSKYKAFKYEVADMKRRVQELEVEFVRLERMIIDKEIEIKHTVKVKHNHLRNLRSALRHARKDLGYE